ncbi:TRAP transporter large permease [Paraburkholderia dipogonis]|uniref:TRAP transporter large permease protein n=1 Tax=Paraburkholderia dipogonis TaxID=1211383 RepID=A0ABW9B4F9_9BURK
MPPELQIAMSFGTFLLLLACGMSVPFAIAVPGTLFLFLQNGFSALRGLGLVSWGSMDSFTLTAVPLFVLMAEIMQFSGLSSRIYRGLSRLVCRVPGGLVQTNIVGCALFAAITGSSVATAASIGGVALPQLLRRGYEPRLSAGSLAAGGTLGILFPPSVALIIYGSLTDTSIAKLFMAGVIPGLMLTAMFMLYVGIYALARPKSTPAEPPLASLIELGRALVDVVPFVLLIGGTMGSMYLGLVTPVEAATAGSIFATILAILMGDMSLDKFRQALRRTVLIVGNLLFIIYAAFIFAYAIDTSGVGEELTNWIVSLHLTRVEFFLALFLLYSILGCLVESIGMMVVTVPLLHPVLLQYGISPIWFGVILVMYIELGQISPPIGINLFVIQSIWTGVLRDVVLGTMPFHVIMFVLLLILSVWPDLVMWLPGRM